MKLQVVRKQPHGNSWLEHFPNCKTAEIRMKHEEEVVAVVVIVIVVVVVVAAAVVVDLVLVTNQPTNQPTNQLPPHPPNH